VGFLGGFFWVFFWWVFYCQPCLDGGHVVPEVGDGEQLLLLADPGLLLLDLGEELLVDDALLQLLAAPGRHVLQLLPDVGELAQALFNLGAAQLRHVDQLLASLLHGRGAT
jgi:hypothetical protein